MTGTTLLLRQVHPSFVQAGRVTSQAFRPTPKDNSLLSVYDGDQITPEKSRAHFTSQDNCKSCGVMAVTVDECSAEDLPTRADPAPFPEHAVVDFNGIADGQIERKGKKLKAKAEIRSWLYQAPSTA
jgi:hypothetical protein